jgi:protein gp37
MAETSHIEWTDATFNPWIGCTKISPACDHCYAERSTPARTLGIVWGPKAARRRTTAGNWNLPRRWNADHGAFFAQHGRRRRVFCASLADVFDNQVPVQWRMDLFSLIAETPNLDWLILTKRISNVMPMCSGDSLMLDMLAERVWLGSTICNQEEADRDIPKLLAVPARVRFLSMEPLLGPVDLRFHIFSEPTGAFRTHAGKRQLQLRRPDDGGLHWVIVGGESGPNARPMHPDWARSLRDQCVSAGVLYLFKQWGEWTPCLKDSGHIASEKEIVMDGAWLLHVGKKAAGRLLDDRTWDGFPQAQATAIPPGRGASEVRG